MSEPYQIPCQNTTPNLDWAFRTGLTGLWAGLTALDRSDRSDRGASLPGGITPLYGFQLDVLYVHFNRLDEIYAMVQSN